MKEKVRVAVLIAVVLSICSGAGAGAAGGAPPEPHATGSIPARAVAPAPGRPDAATPVLVRPPTATVEPTLPLVIEMGFEDAWRGPEKAQGRMLLEIRADGPVSDLTLELMLPPGMRLLAEGDLPRRPITMAAGERRRYSVGVASEGPGRRGVRIEVSFLDETGRRQRLGQGATLAPDITPGRSHLGAWEVMAVPMSEPPR